MKQILTVLLFIVSISTSVFADGPMEFEGTKPVDENNPKLHQRQRDGGSFTKKPEVVLSTVGPVPVGTVPQAPGVPGSGNGLNVNDLNVLVAPPGIVNPNAINGGNQPPPVATTIVVP